MWKKLMKKILNYILISNIFALNAIAAQCVVLPEEKANKAVELLIKHKKRNPIAVIDLYCEACRDEYPRPIVLENVELINFQVEGYKQIMINNKKIDLAYSYLNGVNIASMIDCKAIGVKKYF